MKRLLSIIAGGLLVASGAAFAYDTPGADWMKREQVTQKLESMGYTNITGLEADDGHWEGKGVKNGKITEFHVDPHTGTITKEDIDN